jgi:hypothetical protein
MTTSKTGPSAEAAERERIAGASTSCPVCGRTDPHSHAEKEIEDWLAALVARWGYGARAYQLARPECDFKTRYFELILEVGTVHEGESRHATALRYVREREALEHEPAALSAIPQPAEVVGPAWRDKPDAEGWWLRARVGDEPGWYLWSIRPHTKDKLWVATYSEVHDDFDRWFGPVRIPEDKAGA